MATEPGNVPGTSTTARLENPPIGVAGHVYPDGSIQMEIPDIGPMVNIQPFDLLNGDPATFHSMLVRSTIPPAFYWVPIEGLAPEHALRYTGVFIQCAYAQIQSAMPPGFTEERARRAALVLGVVRAVSTAMYTLAEGDFIPGEITRPMVRVVPVPLDLGGGETDPRTPEEIALAQIQIDHPVDMRYRPRERVPEGSVIIDPNLARDMRDRLQRRLEFTQADRDAAGAILMSALGILPLQGYSLMLTSHHYLSDRGSVSRRAYDVVERQFWKGAGVGAWFENDTDMIRDVMWHKACHPVSMTVKYNAALSDNVASGLRKAGAGSAAARLPAKEPEMRAAQTAISLLQTVRPFLQAYGGELDYRDLDRAILDVEVAARTFDGVGRGMRQERATVMSPREEAVARLVRLIDTNKDTLAIAFGFYKAMVDDSAMKYGRALNDTLGEAYSLRKLQTQSMASFLMGQENYENYKAYKIGEKTRGEYKPLFLTVAGDDRPAAGVAAAVRTQT